MRRARARDSHPTATPCSNSHRRTSTIQGFPQACSTATAGSAFSSGVKRVEGPVGGGRRWPAGSPASAGRFAPLRCGRPPPRPLPASSPPGRRASRPPGRRSPRPGRARRGGGALRAPPSAARTVRCRSVRVGGGGEQGRRCRAPGSAAAGVRSVHQAVAGEDAAAGSPGTSSRRRGASGASSCRRSVRQARRRSGSFRAASPALAHAVERPQGVQRPQHAHAPLLAGEVAEGRVVGHGDRRPALVTGGTGPAPRSAWSLASEPSHSA